VSRGIAVLFSRTFGTRWGGGVSPTPRPPLLPGKTRYTLYTRLGGPQGRSRGNRIPLASSQHNLYVLLCVQCWTPDDGQRNWAKHVEFYSKNKFQKLLHLVGFIIRIYHDDGQRKCPKHVEFFFQKLIREINASSWFYYKKLSWWLTEELSETCRVLFQKLIQEIIASSWFYYKNLSWWWTEELSETCRVLFRKLIREISESSWFYYKNTQQVGSSSTGLAFHLWAGKVISLYGNRLYWEVFFFFF